MSLDHTHEHVFLGSAHEENAKRTLWVVMLTVVMMVAEIAAGALTGSMALLADGFHMATHAGALGIAAAAYAYARRHASSPRFSFGTGKVGDLGGFASALILALVSLGIGIESVMRLLQPTDVQFGTATLIAVVGLVVNIVSALLLGHGHSHGHDHEHEHAHGHHGHDNQQRFDTFTQQYRKCAEKRGKRIVGCSDQCVLCFAQHCLQFFLGISRFTKLTCLYDKAESTHAFFEIFKQFFILGCQCWLGDFKSIKIS